jgi:cytochrome c556
MHEASQEGNLIRKITKPADTAVRVKQALLGFSALLLQACDRAPQDNKADPVAPDAVPAEMQSAEVHKTMERVLATQADELTPFLQTLHNVVSSPENNVQQYVPQAEQLLAKLKEFQEILNGPKPVDHAALKAKLAELKEHASLRPMEHVEPVDEVLDNVELVIGSMQNTLESVK